MLLWVMIYFLNTDKLHDKAWLVNWVRCLLLFQCVNLLTVCPNSVETVRVVSLTSDRRLSTTFTHLTNSFTVMHWLLKSNTAACYLSHADTFSSSVVKTHWCRMKLILQAWSSSSWSLQSSRASVYYIPGRKVFMGGGLWSPAPGGRRCMGPCCIDMLLINGAE